LLDWIGPLAVAVASYGIAVGVFGFEQGRYDAVKFTGVNYRAVGLAEVFTILGEGRVVISTGRWRRGGVAIS